MGTAAVQISNQCLCLDATTITWLNLACLEGYDRLIGIHDHGQGTSLTKMLCHRLHCNVLHRHA